MPWLVVLDGKGYISHCKGIKREFKIFLQVIFRGTVLISKVFWKTIPYFLQPVDTDVFLLWREFSNNQKYVYVHWLYHFVEYNK